MDTANVPELTITRTLDFPLEKVWNAFITAEAMGAWWGPKGFDIVVKTFEFRKGGIFHYSMTPPGAQTIWGRFTYGEIVPMESITFINCFSDAEAGLGRNPWMEVWPAEVSNVMAFAEEGGKTTITLRGSPINATEEEMKAFAGLTESMQGGWEGTWSKLEDYLAQS